MGVIVGAGGYGSAPGDVSVTKDLSDQIDGIKQVFDVGEPFEHLIAVFWNGLNQISHVVNTTGTQFTLDFVPTNRPGAELTIIYNRG